MNLQINTMTMTVTNINPTTENHGGEDVLATDISLLANMPSELLAKFSDSEKDWGNKWKGLLWNKEGEITGHCLKHLEFHHEYKDHILRIQDDEENVMEFTKVKIQKFQAEPVPGHRINLKFQIRVHPTKRENGELTALQKQQTTVEILPSPQGDLLQDQKHD